MSEAKRLKKKYPNIGDDFHELYKILKKDPITGSDYLSNDCYKVRMPIADKGRGDRGGARVIIQVLIVDKEVYVLSVYDKGEKDNILDKEIDRLLKNKLSHFKK